MNQKDNKQSKNNDLSLSLFVNLEPDTLEKLPTLELIQYEYAKLLNAVIQSYERSIYAPKVFNRCKQDALELFNNSWLKIKEKLG